MTSNQTELIPETCAKSNMKGLFFISKDEKKSCGKMGTALLFFCCLAGTKTVEHVARIIELKKGNVGRLGLWIDHFHLIGPFRKMEMANPLFIEKRGRLFEISRRKWRVLGQHDTTSHSTCPGCPKISSKAEKKCRSK